ncbi:MAG: TRAP transporter small permease [bacterium]|nr:TRAP transporter small permease [bacterium]
MAMLLAAIVQVISRNFLGGGIDWLDFWVRHSVLYLGLLGAVSATRLGNQIKIDAIIKLLPFSVSKWFQLFTTIVTSFICIWLADASLKMIQMEKEAGTVLIGNIKTSMLLWIFPISFVLIAVNSIFHFIFIFQSKEDKVNK